MIADHAASATAVRTRRTIRNIPPKPCWAILLARRIAANTGDDPLAPVPLHFSQRSCFSNRLFSQFRRHLQERQFNLSFQIEPRCAAAASASGPAPRPLQKRRQKYRRTSKRCRRHPCAKNREPLHTGMAKLIVFARSTDR